MKSSAIWKRLRKTKEVIIIENQKVILYSSLTCGVCKMVETQLKNKKIQYERCCDISIMEQNGVQSIPTLQVNNNFYLAQDAYKWIASQEAIV